MSGLHWVVGPSRTNDRNLTTLALLDARRACVHRDLDAAIALTGFALDTVVALHPGARGWNQHRDAEATWLTLRSAAVWQPSLATAFATMVLMSQRLGALAHRVVQADADEKACAELEAAMSGQEGT